MGRVSSAEGWTRPEEAPFVRRVHDWIQDVQSQTKWKLTDFLTPREAHILESVAKHEGVAISKCGGLSDTERCRVLIMPDDWYPQREDFNTVILQIDGPADLSHGSILGSVLATGIDRKKIGDIWVLGTIGYIAVCQEIAQFLLTNWRNVGHHVVRLSVAVPDLRLPQPNYAVETVSLASLRIDSMLARACKWSRAKAQAAISRGQVSLNFVEVQNPAQSVSMGDILSVRGFGRIKIEEVLGKSKKDRERVQIGVLLSSS